MYVTPSFGRGLGRRCTPRTSGGGECSAGRASGTTVGSTRYRQPLDGFENVRLNVEFETWYDDVIDYVLILTAELGNQVETIRVYDGTHGWNEMHRYTKGLGKQQGEEFHRGTLGEGMRAAMNAIKQGYEEMIDGWRRG